MKTIKNKKSIQWVRNVAYIAFVACIVTILLRKHVETNAETANAQHLFSNTRESASYQSTHNSGIADRSSQNQTTNKRQYGNYQASFQTSPPSSFTYVVRRVQFILIGGILLTIGTICIPFLLPHLQMPGARVKFQHILHRSVTTHKARLRRHLFPSRSNNRGDNGNVHLPYTGGTRNLESPSENEAHVQNTHALVSSLNLSSDTAPVVKTTKAFLHQSGFQFAEPIYAGLLITQHQRYGEIPVFIMKEHRILDSPAVQTIFNIIHATETLVNTRIALVVVKNPLQADTYQQIYHCRSYDNLAIIPVNQTRIAQAVWQASCSQTVESLLNFSVEYHDFYDQNTPVVDAFGFFGRQEMLNTLLNAVSHLQHIGVCGLRKIGKTSLVLQLKEQLSHHIVVYVAGEALVPQGTNLYHMLLEECLREISYKYPHVTLPEIGMILAADDHNAARSVLQHIATLWDCLKPYRHDVKVIFLFDEIEHLLADPTEVSETVSDVHEFIRLLKDMSRHYKFLASVMMFSSTTLSENNPWQEQRFSGFQCDKIFFISSLSEDKCNRMICDLGAQMGLVYTEESLSRIYYETGGHPYITRQLCSVLAQKIPRRKSGSWSADSSPEQASQRVTVQVKNVEAAVLIYTEYHCDYLQSLWQQLSPLAQEILSTIAVHDSCSLEDLMPVQHDHETRRIRRKAISTLIEHKLIERCEQKYSMTMGLFERFILTTN